MDKNMERSPYTKEAERTVIKKRKDLFLFIFLVLLGVCTLFALYVKQGSGKEFSFAGKKGSIKVFEPVKVHKIEISWQENKVNLLLGKDGFWHLAERNMALASASRVGDLLHNFASIRILKQLHDPSGEVLKKLSLVENTDPKDNTRPGIKAVLKDASGKILFQILLGRGHYPPAVKDAAGTVTAKGRYILTGNKVFLAAQLFEDCIPLPQVYIEPLAVRNMNMAQLILMSSFTEKSNDPAVKYALVRQRTNIPFRVLHPQGKVPDMKKLSAISDTLSRQLTLDLVPSISVSSIKPEKMMTIQLADGFSYRLQMAKKDNGELLIPTVSFDAKKIRKQAGESDKLFQARVSGAKLRFESEKRYYNGKVFRMIPGTMKKLSASPFPERKKPIIKRTPGKGGKQKNTGKKVPVTKK